MFRTLSLAASLACIAFAAKSHEFWIDPQAHQIEVGDRVVANLRVGSEFSGAAQSYLPPQFHRFDMVQNGKLSSVDGRIGDRPAVNLRAEEDGLLVLIHETKDFRIVWDDFEKFIAFVEHKDATWTLEAHKERGLSEKNVAEAYSRFAKSLIGVGSGKGNDVVAGLLTEIVALENPYTDDMSDGIDVRVLYDGKPRAEEQVEVFEKPRAGDIRISYVRTDENGEVTVPVNPGSRYMLDSVVLRVPSETKAKNQNVRWESLWANLTFSVPQN